MKASIIASGATRTRGLRGLVAATLLAAASAGQVLTATSAHAGPPPCDSGIEVSYAFYGTPEWTSDAFAVAHINDAPVQITKQITGSVNTRWAVTVSSEAQLGSTIEVDRTLDVQIGSLATNMAMEIHSKFGVSVTREINHTWSVTDTMPIPAGTPENPTIAYYKAGLAVQTLRRDEKWTAEDCSTSTSYKFVNLAAYLAYTTLLDGIRTDPARARVAMRIDQLNLPQINPGMSGGPTGVCFLQSCLPRDQVITNGGGGGGSAGGGATSPGVRGGGTVADLTGDQKADVIAVYGDDMYVYPSNGTALGARHWIGNGWTAGVAALDFGDITADGKADAVMVTTGGDMYVYPSNGSYLGASYWIGNGWTGCRLGG